MFRRVCFFVYPGFQLLDLSGPLAAFQIAARLRPGSYELLVASAHGAAVTTSVGVTIQTTAIGGARFDTFIIPGGDHAHHLEPATLAIVLAAATQANRVASICTGAFPLAASGLLDGRRATTHWAYASQLQAEYPTVRVEPDRIFVQDGNVWTAAGVTAGIDLALALIEADLDIQTARAVARKLVVYHRRAGGQSQSR